MASKRQNAGLKGRTDAWQAENASAGLLGAKEAPSCGCPRSRRLYLVAAGMVILLGIEALVAGACFVGSLYRRQALHHKVLLNLLEWVDKHDETSQETPSVQQL